MHSLGREPQERRDQSKNEPPEGATDPEPLSGPEMLTMS